MRKLGLADARGSTTVEFALVVPILVLLTVGLLDVARAMNASAATSTAIQMATTMIACPPLSWIKDDRLTAASPSWNAR